MTMVIVFINNLTVKAVIGTKNAERRKTQSLIVNIRFAYDARKAVLKDSLTDAVDYESLARLIRGRVRQTKFQLIESLAYFIAKTLLHIKQVREATVRVDKFKAVKSSKSVAVQLTLKK